MGTCKIWIRFDLYTKLEPLPPIEQQIYLTMRALAVVLSRSLVIFSHSFPFTSFLFPTCCLCWCMCARSELEREYLRNCLVVTWYCMGNILNPKQKLHKGGEKKVSLYRNLKRLFIHITITFKWLTSVQTYVTVKQNGVFQFISICAHIILSTLFHLSCHSSPHFFVFFLLPEENPR